MNMAAKAVANAITIEVKKDGLVQRQTGDWQLRFTVAALDMDNRITSAPMGSRFQCVLVEIDDDETPVDHVARARDKWRDLGPTQQAGMRCKEPLFRTFLREGKQFDWCYTEDDGAVAVREFCGVESRSQLGKPGHADERVKWHQLDDAYLAWKVKEHA